MAMSDNVNLAWKMFKDLGYSDISTSALIGNMMEESYPDVRPTAFNKNENAFGILQWRDTSGTNDAGVSWNSPRIQWLNAFAEQNGLDPEDIRTQILFTDWELKNKFKGAYNKLWNAKDLAEATTIVDRDYVYSLGTSRNNRIKNANQVLKNLAGTKGDMNYYGSETNPVELDKIVKKKNESTGTGDDRSQFQNIINTSYVNQANGEDMETDNLGLSGNNNNNKKETFVGRFKNYLTDPDNFGDFMGRLGTLANRLTLDPDPQYAERMNEGRLLQQQLEKQNRTADVLENMGYPELAQMMRNGEISGANALGYIKSKESVPSDLKIFRMLKESGEIPPDTEFTEWKARSLGVTDNFKDKEIFKLDVERYKKADEETSAFSDMQMQLDLMESLLDDGIYTGGGAELKLATLRLAEQVGLTSEETNEIIANTESFEAFSNRVVLAIMGGSLGVGFSDGDRLFTKTQVPNLGNTEQGNRDLIKYSKAVMQRKIILKNEMAKYLYGGVHKDLLGNDKDYSGGLREYEKWAYKFADDNPIFPEIDTL